MYWIADVNDLSYYNTPEGMECYCYQLEDASDLRLHGVMDYNGTLTSYTGTVLMYEADGITLIGGITAYFTFNFGRNPAGSHFFTAILNSIPPAFCSHPCFVLKVQIKNGTIIYFNYFTDTYCAPSECCDTPTGITILQTGTLQPLVNYTDSNNPNTPVIGVKPRTTTETCSKPTLKLETFSDCYDNVTQRYYQRN